MQHLHSFPTRRSSDLFLLLFFLRRGFLLRRRLGSLFGRSLGCCRSLPIGLTRLADHSEHRTHLDRKSTRLNSSHSQRSYAVFCMIKKRPTACTTFCCK